MEMWMKISKFKIERIPIEVEYIRPIAGRLFLLFNMHRFVKFRKIQTVVYNKKCKIVNCGKPFYRLYVPKIMVIKGGDAL